MIFWFMSGGWCFPLSGELSTESGGLCCEGDNGVRDGVGEFYFRQYGCLDNLQFRNFVERELYGCSCEALEVIPKVSLLDRYLVGEGSHRRLSTTFRLEMPAEFQSEIGVDSCELIFVERLPLGVSADPFELQNLQQRGVLKEAFVFGDTNLELPSFLSNRSLVEVHMDVDPSSMSNKIDYNLELPLHGRYQPLDDSGYTNVEFRAPDTFVRCKMNDEANIRNCVSVLKGDGSISNSKAIIWRLPSGIGAHEGKLQLKHIVPRKVIRKIQLLKSLGSYIERNKKRNVSAKIDPIEYTIYIYGRVVDPTKVISFWQRIQVLP